jgi:lon-related putative ATP-dependent protease
MNEFEVGVKSLRRIIDPSSLKTGRSKHIQSLGTIVGQNRALKALEFGVGNKAYGFNIFVSGYPGTGRQTAVEKYIQKKSKEQAAPPDWCYVHNFNNSYHPKILKLPTGRAKKFRNDMRQFVLDVKKALLRAFEGNEYLKQREDFIKLTDQKKSEMFLSLNKKAVEEGFSIQQTPFGVAPIPLDKNGEPLSSEYFQKLEKSEQERIIRKQEEFRDAMKASLRKSRNVEKEVDEKVKKLDRKVCENAIQPLIEELMDDYSEVPDVTRYLKEVRSDILENFSDFLEKDKTETQALPFIQPKSQSSLKRYDVNVFIDNSKTEGAPLIQEFNPTYNNLFGKIEKESQMGTIITDFTLIISGSLHRANGGYLVIPVIELFKNPFSWDTLKNALINKEIKIEEISERLGFVTTKTLQPEPMPLNLQVILIGRPEIYQMLYAYDNDFRNLFKIKAEFDTTLELDEKNINNYIAFVSDTKLKENLNSFDKGGLAKIIEYGCRLANDQYKLSARFSQIYDIVIESDYYCKLSENKRIMEDDVKKAIEEKEYRSNLIQEKLNEMIKNQLLMVDVKGKKTGQVNGIAVLSLLDFSFGKPSRITATIGVGMDGIVDIEREAKLGGKIHSKGVMILSGYLMEKFAADKPVSLSARLVFEQSYEGVEGDSASSAELYALLSSLADLPVNQSIAVTGSVNQKGEIQAVGGINDKIEGFYEVCKLFGLTGHQGVIIPGSNIRSLMLKEEIVEAVEAKKFHVWAVKDIDEGISILTGIKAGKRMDDGRFEKDSVNARVDKRLEDLAEHMKRFRDFPR